jgi:mono/diheme cytochrome c family protein
MLTHSGRIAVPDNNPKTWRSRGRKRRPQPDLPTIIEGVKSPAEIAREKRRQRLIRNYGFSLLALMLAATSAVAEEQAALKPGPGLDAVVSSCSVCHTLDYIRMNSPFLTPDAWKAEVSKMREAFGAPIDEETAATIVKYLSATYAAPKH